MTASRFEAVSASLFGRFQHVPQRPNGLFCILTYGDETASGAACDCKGKKVQRTLAVGHIPFVFEKDFRTESGCQFAELDYRPHVEPHRHAHGDDPLVFEGFR